MNEGKNGWICEWKWGIDDVMIDQMGNSRVGEKKIK